MPSFKSPGFQERVAVAAKAKQAALEKLRARLPLDEVVIAARLTARAAQEAAEAKKREAKRAAWEEEKAARKARAAERRELEQCIPVLTDAEKKAARDARYQRRKSRAGK